MRIVIVYMTRHGCSENAAKKLAEKLNENVQLVNLKKDRNPDLTGFDAIIVGGSIHAGRIQGKIKKYCDNNLDILLKKRLGLFLSCMEEGEKAQEQFDAAYPEDLRRHAAAMGLFGGEFNFNRMNFIEKAIVKKVANVTKSESKIKEDAIVWFANSFKKK